MYKTRTLLCSVRAKMRTLSRCLVLTNVPFGTHRVTNQPTHSLIKLFFCAPASRVRYTLYTLLRSAHKVFSITSCSYKTQNTCDRHAKGCSSTPHSDGRIVDHSSLTTSVDAPYSVMHLHLVLSACYATHTQHLDEFQKHPT